MARGRETATRAGDSRLIKTAAWREAHQQDVAQQGREERAKAKKSAGGRRGLEGGWSATTATRTPRDPKRRTHDGGLWRVRLGLEESAKGRSGWTAFGAMSHTAPMPQSMTTDPRGWRSARSGRSAGERD